MGEAKTIHVPVEELETFEGRCKWLYRIKDKGMDTVPFIFSDSQKILNEIVQAEYERTKRENGVSVGRFIVLKPRQIGATTFFGILAFDKLLNEQGTHTLTMAHNSDTTKLIYEIYKRCYDNLPDFVIPTRDDKPMTWLDYMQYKDPAMIAGLSPDEVRSFSVTVATIKIKPTPKSYTGNLMSFVDNDSRSIIQTAGSKDDAGKGITPNVFHSSEAANYPDYHATVTSVNPSLPKGEKANGVLVVIESTANGVSGVGEGFYKDWTRSVKAWEAYQTGKSKTFSELRPIFVPWYMIEEYEMPLAGGQLESLEGIDFGGPEEKQKFLEKEEMMRKGIFNPLTRKVQVVTEEKINWYRWVIKNDCGYDYATAKRYYPTTPEEAFSASSFTYFDMSKMTEVKSKYLNKAPEYVQGNLDWGEDQDVEFVPDPIGGWNIFEMPDPKWENRYVIGVDIGRGYEDGDYSVAVVKDRLTGKFVAMYHNKIDQDLFAEEVVKGGYFYNEALLVPESNLDVVVTLINPDGITPYLGPLYYHEHGSSIRWGYHTHGASRMPLLSMYKAFLRDNENGYEAIPSIQMLDQHITFVRKAPTRVGGAVKYEADEGEHDDIVIACALAEAGDRFMINMGEIVQERKDDNRIVSLVKQTFRPTKRRRQSQLGRRVS